MAPPDANRPRPDAEAQGMAAGRTRVSAAGSVHAFNVVLTLALIGVLLFQLMPLEVAFVVAFALALAVNLPNWDDQQELLKQHGGNVVLVVSMIFAAGVLHRRARRDKDDHGDGRGTRLGDPGWRRRAAPGPDAR